MSKREPCKVCGCDDWDEYWGPVCKATSYCSTAVVDLEQERDRYKDALEQLAYHVTGRELQMILDALDGKTLGDA